MCDRKSRRIVAAALGFLLCFCTQVLAEPAVIPKGEILLDESSVNGIPDRLIARNLTYRTYDPKDDPLSHFEPEALLGTVRYRLEQASSPVIEDQESVSYAGGIYLSEPFLGDGKDHMPAPVREFDGVQMELVSQKLVDTETEERTEVQSISYEYEGLEADTGIPLTQDIEFTDTDTGNVFTAPLILQSSETTDRYWSDTFAFPVHIEDVTADVFLLGDVEIPKEDALIDHAADFLQLLSLDPAYYEITSIDWNGEPYTDADGVECRDAIARGRKLLRDVTAVYRGEVTFPPVAAKAWECEYREILPEGCSVVYTMSVDITLVPADSVKTAADEEPGGIRGLIKAVYHALKEAVGKVAEIVREHPAETVVCLVVSAAFIVFLLLTGIKRQCIYQEKITCPYRRRTAEACKTCVHRYQNPPAKKGIISLKRGISQQKKE